MNFDRPNLMLAHIHGIIDREEYDRLHAGREGKKAAAGDKIEDLCEAVQDAVNEVIRVCRDHGRCERTFEDLSIEAYAYPHSSGKIAWGLNSLKTGLNTRRGIVE